MKEAAIDFLILMLRLVFKVTKYGCYTQMTTTKVIGCHESKYSVVPHATSFTQGTDPDEIIPITLATSMLFERS